MASPWTLELFLEKLDRWIELEQPPEAVRVRAMAWVFTRMDDPYLGARREAALPNLWYLPIPETLHGDGVVVTCAFYIVESGHTVRCESFGTLSWPV